MNLQIYDLIDASIIKKICNENITISCQVGLQCLVLTTENQVYLLKDEL